MSDPCTCNLGANECDGQFGVFWPLQDGGSCAVRPCQRPATSTAGVPERVRPGEKRWPFVESPAEFTRRLCDARDHFGGDMLAAVRNVLIENPPTLEAAAGVATDERGQP